MKIGILQTGNTPSEFVRAHGDFDDMFRLFLAEEDMSFDTFAVNKGILPNGVDDADGWLITGSKDGVYDGHAWISSLEDFIRHCAAKEHPVVGVCFGHQVMAQALGGSVQKFGGGWTIGCDQYRFSWGEDLSLIAWHQDQVLRPPASAVVIGRSARSEHAALMYGDYGLSFQPHPEFEMSFVRDMLEAQPAEVSEDARRTALETLSGTLSRSRTAELIQGFFRQRRIDGLQP